MTEVGKPSRVELALAQVGDKNRHFIAELNREEKLYVQLKPRGEWVRHSTYFSALKEILGDGKIRANDGENWGKLAVCFSEEDTKVVSKLPILFSGHNCSSLLVRRKLVPDCTPVFYSYVNDEDAEFIRPVAMTEEEVRRRAGENFHALLEDSQFGYENESRVFRDVPIDPENVVVIVSSPQERRSIQRSFPDYKVELDRELWEMRKRERASKKKELHNTRTLLWLEVQNKWDYEEINEVERVAQMERSIESILSYIRTLEIGLKVPKRERISLPREEESIRKAIKAKEEQQGD